MARYSGGWPGGGHWWQRRPLVALVVGWALIGGLALAVVMSWGR